MSGAHYRWGVYDEYPVDENAPQFYAAQNGIYEGTRCSLASPGNESLEITHYDFCPYHFSTKNIVPPKNLKSFKLYVGRFRVQSNKWHRMCLH